MVIDFFGASDIPVGVDQHILNFVYQCDQPGDHPLNFVEEGLGSPPIVNIIVVGGVSIGIDEGLILTDGQAICEEAQPPCDPVDDPTVRTQGFWKRVCNGPHPSGEHDNLPEYVDFVNDFATFELVFGVEDMCERLNPDPKNDMCEKAEAQFMALLLNIASGRVAVCNCVDDPDLGLTTVGEVAVIIDDLLSNPERTFEECQFAKSVADDINNGDTLVDCP